MEASNFNKNHPELQEGEVFFMNKPDGEEVGELHGIESHRLGQDAYTSNGVVIEGWKPMFVRFKQ